MSYDGFRYLCPCQNSYGEFPRPKEIEFEISVARDKFNNEMSVVKFYLMIFRKTFSRVILICHVFLPMVSNVSKCVRDALSGTVSSRFVQHICMFSPRTDTRIVKCRCKSYNIFCARSRSVIAQKAASNRSFIN